MTSKSNLLRGKTRERQKPNIDVRAEVIES